MGLLVLVDLYIFWHVFSGYLFFALQVYESAGCSFPTDTAPVVGYPEDDFPPRGITLSVAMLVGGRVIPSVLFHHASVQVVSNSGVTGWVFLERTDKHGILNATAKTLVSHTLIRTDRVTKNATLPIWSMSLGLVRGYLIGTKFQNWICLKRGDPQSRWLSFCCSSNTHTHTPQGVPSNSTHPFAFWYSLFVQADIDAHESIRRAPYQLLPRGAENIRVLLKAGCSFRSTARQKAAILRAPHLYHHHGGLTAIKLAYVVGISGSRIGCG